MPLSPAWALLLSALIIIIIILCPERTTHAFVWVPSPQPQKNYYSSPWSSSTHRCGSKNIRYSSTTALFVRNTSGEQNNNRAIAINKKLVELGKKRLWKDLLKIAKEEQVRFNNVNYATVMSQLGRIRSFDRSDPHFLAFLKAMATKIGERGLPWIKPREASNIIHAIGKMQLRNPSTKRILEWISTPETAAIFVEKGKPQAIANTAWACATLSFEAPNLFAKIEEHSKWLVEEGDPQAVANTAWACATLGFEAPNLFAEIERQSKWLVKEGKPQEVANTAWACATLGFEAPNLFAEINRQSKWLVETGDPQAVANTAWACATLGFESPELFAEIEHRSKWLVRDGTLQEVSNTAWACAKLGYKAPHLFAEIECRSKWLVQEGNPQDVANTVWACATLGYEALEFFFDLDRHADKLIEHGNFQDISNTCYAIAVSGKSKNFDSLLRKLWERAINLFITGEEFIDEALRQLAQTRMFAKVEGIKFVQIPKPMANSMQLALSRSDKNVAQSSKQVSLLLHEIGFPHECEVSPDSSPSGGMLAIDFACPRGKIAIEFDGPSHFLKAVGSGKLTSTENGATKAKRRYLEQLGWTVINIDYRDYIQAKQASNEERWLREKLHAFGIQC